jgi:hypothetical protein
VRRLATLDEQFSERAPHVFVAGLPCNDERQAFPAGLVDDGQDVILASGAA